MSKIIQLSEQVSNLIAAGEVVTGPESVIKELVENSIDAKSDDIEINLLDSGLESIEIIDNGSGMDETDAILAFNRHATSKIKTAYDLGSIQTLGFRGEALPSIASVSRLDLYTKTSDKTYGTHVVMQAGKLVEKETSACDTGTRIKVTKLFYNTPARLKYLKSSSAILASICTLVDKLALTNKNLKIKLTNNGNTLLQTDGSGNVLNMFYSVYGASISKLINHTEASSDGIKVDIYHSTPVISRSRKNDITLVVNGRLVQSNLVNNAVIEAYHSYLPMNRYPVCLIDIDIDPLLIDINVHPQKMEIKFSISDKIYSLIKDTLTLSLKNLTIIPEVSDEESEEVEQLSFADNLHFESDKEVVKPRFEEPIETKKEALSDIIVEQEETQTEPVIEEVKEERKRRIPYFEYIGQLSGTYLLFQNEEGLYLVDQHAAQERINYEKYARMLSTPNTSNIEMLVPYSITLTKEESIVLANNLDSLKQYGIIVEESGLNSFFVRTIPVWIKEDNPEIVIEKMIYFLLEQNCFDIGRIRDSLAKQMACKASIKANHYVTSFEANSLIEQLDKCDNPFNCPHGRPVFVKITNYEIEKMFKRVG